MKVLEGLPLLSPFDVDEYGFDILRDVVEVLSGDVLAVPDFIEFMQEYFSLAGEVVDLDLQGLQLVAPLEEPCDFVEVGELAG